LMRTLDTLGCPVPQKIRVVGFDDAGMRNCCVRL
jgi:hypothetical protein